MTSKQTAPPTTRRKPILTVVDRMVSLDLAKTLGSILLVLVIIIVSRKFMGILTKAIEGQVSTDTLFQLLGLKTLAATAILIPPSTFMAILTVIGRMYRDHEMSVLASAGAGAKRMYRALSFTILPVALLSGWMALEVMPWSEGKAQALMKRDEETADVRGIKPGRFNEFSSGDVVLYAEEMDTEQVMHRIFVQNRQADNTALVIADRGHLEKSESGDDFMVLYDGTRYQGTPGAGDYVISQFDEYGVRISGPESESAALKREAEDTRQLLIHGTPKELAELQKRLAVPLGVMALAILAVPLARMAPRQGPYGNVFSAFLIYILYENAQKITQGMLMTQKIPAWASYALIYGLLLAMTLALFLRNLGPRWIRHTITRRSPA